MIQFISSKYKNKVHYDTEALNINLYYQQIYTHISGLGLQGIFKGEWGWGTQN